MAGKKGVNVFVTGQRHAWHNEFKSRLDNRVGLQETNKDQSDVTLAFCTITSRVGTDVEGAVQGIPADKHAVLAVFHSTYERDYVVPESRRFAKRDNILVVDILFNEDEGIMSDARNDAALKQVSDFLMGYVVEDSDVSPDAPRGGSVPRKCCFIAVAVIGVVIITVILLLAHHSKADATYLNQTFTPNSTV